VGFKALAPLIMSPVLYPYILLHFNQLSVNKQLCNTIKMIWLVNYIQGLNYKLQFPESKNIAPTKPNIFKAILSN
jgi:hypothetical protein